MNGGKLTRSFEADEVGCPSHKRRKKIRYVPIVENVIIRTTLGLVLVALSATVAIARLSNESVRFDVVLFLIVLAWLPAVYLTDKYVHKYPQRYITYLIASHLKAAVMMAFFIWLISVIADSQIAPINILWTSFALFVLVDAFASIPYRQDKLSKQPSSSNTSSSKITSAYNQQGESSSATTELCMINTQAILNSIRPELTCAEFGFIEKQIPDQQGTISDVLILDDITDVDDPCESIQVGLIFGRTRINDVLRLNRFLQYCAKRITMGGFLVIRYVPFENFKEGIRRRYPGALYWLVITLHFVWFRGIPKIPWLDRLYFSSTMSWLDKINLSITRKRNRALPKAETWGRLAFCGMDVVAESSGDGELCVIAQRVSPPVSNKRPSYYPVVSLEKVGLDGGTIRLYKLRSMYPFSEFLQKRIFEDHGLTATGKFSRDFRLTDFGTFLRKYWLDELPQILDWLRGDVKLVGMRATSQQFLSLYPKELYDLYIQIKPGLIPPIFDETSSGFDHIVDVELTYLRDYWDHPIRSDIRYFVQTFNDIVFRGVRSK